jgi:SAM-dependent methyltransferase
MSDYRELLIGCGRSREKRLYVPLRPMQPWQNLTALDLNPNVGADLQCDLNAVPPWIAWPRVGTIATYEELVSQGLSDQDRLYAFSGKDYEQVGYHMVSDCWDEIHAYEVLEHLGSQGDAHALLSQFSELWRLLKPDGYLCATVPSRFSEGLWGDPSHRRAIVPLTLVFLDQDQYRVQIDDRIAAAQPPTAMSDFRDTCGYRADFRTVDQHDNRTTFSFVLQAVKPSRYGLKS